MARPRFKQDGGGAFSFDVQIDGFDQVQERLRALADNRMRGKVLRGGVGAMLAVFRTGIKRRLPARTGTLRNSVRSSTRLWAARMEATGRVNVGNRVAGGGRKGAKGMARGAFYAAMVEGGTKAHEIRARSGRVLKFGNLYRRSVKHPGMAGRGDWAETRRADEPAAQVAFRTYVDARLNAIWNNPRLPPT